MIMKELSIEQKAKAYDKAIEIAKKNYDAAQDLCEGSQIGVECFKSTLENIFPELKESEDERIRKKLLALVEWSKSYAASGITNDDAKKMLAWLEKQGQVKDFAISQHENKICKESDDSLTSEDERIKENIIATIHLYYGEPLEDEAEEMLAWLEKQGQTFTKKDVDDAYLKGVCDTKHELEKQGEESRRQRVEEAMREIDEKSKDFVEAFQGKTSEEILAEMRGKQKPFDEYEGLTDFERTLADICIGWIGQELGWKQYIKDNADALLRIAVEKFNSVQDAPFEKNPAWSEECKEAFSDICENCCGRTVELVKKIMQPKQEWSEDDEKMRLELIQYFVDGNDLKHNLAYIFDWLKSFKDRVQPQNTWKPSDEQMDALDSTLQYSQVSNNSYEHLNSLYNDLKKL